MRLGLSPIFICRFFRCLWLGAFCCVPLIAHAEHSRWASLNAHQGEFLAVEQAFQLRAMLSGESIGLHWKIAPNYYLYKHRVRTKLQKSVAGVQLEPLIFVQQAQSLRDPNYGLVEVYKLQLDVNLPLAHWRAAHQPPLSVWVDFQGCSAVGLCYPLQTYRLRIRASGVELRNETHLLSRASLNSLLAQQPHFSLLALSL